MTFGERTLRGEGISRVWNPIDRSFLSDERGRPTRKGPVLCESTTLPLQTPTRDPRSSPGPSLSSFRRSVRRLDIPFVTEKKTRLSFRDMNCVSPGEGVPTSNLRSDGQRDLLVTQGRPVTRVSPKRSRSVSTNPDLRPGPENPRVPSVMNQHSPTSERGDRGDSDRLPSPVLGPEPSIKILLSTSG